MSESDEEVYCKCPADSAGSGHVKSCPRRMPEHDALTPHERQMRARLCRNWILPVEKPWRLGGE